VPSHDGAARDCSSYAFDPYHVACQLHNVPETTRFREVKSAAPGRRGRTVPIARAPMMN